MKKISFTVTVKKFDKKGEKSGWTYFDIPAELAQQLNPGVKKGYNVKGKLDRHVIERVAILPMGNGDFIMPLNAALRKAVGKRAGATMQVQLELDTSAFEFNKDLMACLRDEPGAIRFFKTLPGSHQRYFSKWIDAAKTDPTRVKRIAMAVDALSKNLGYAEMLRQSSNKT